MPISDDERLAWALAAVASRWRGATIGDVRALRGDASARRFWRLGLNSSSSTAPPSVILTDLGPNDFPGYVRVLGLIAKAPPEQPWINLHRFLTTLGARVPLLYAYDAARRAMVVEDAGETALFDILRARDAASADWMRVAVENLLVLHVDGTRRIGPECIASAIAYDERLFRWEMNEFVELGYARVAPGADPGALAGELDALAHELGNFPRVFSHRDYHAHNLYAPPRANPATLVMLDFQDALMAPAAQDLAVLMTTRDTAALLPAGLEDRLLQFYFAGLLRRQAADLGWSEFIRSYRLAALQHALKMIGRFVSFERDGKTEYSRFVPYAHAVALRILSGGEGASFPRLARAMCEPPFGEGSQ